MEAPKKVYFTPTENGTCYYTEGIPFERESIEYVRKDAFIEKACEFIKERFSFEDSWHVKGETSILDKVIADFKKYVEEQQ
jgi:hypothetical protein